MFEGILILKIVLLNRKKKKTNKKSLEHILDMCLRARYLWADGVIRSIALFSLDKVRLVTGQFLQYEATLTVVLVSCSVTLTPVPKGTRVCL